MVRIILTLLAALVCGQALATSGTNGVLQRYNALYPGTSSSNCATCHDGAQLDVGNGGLFTTFGAGLASRLSDSQYFNASAIDAALRDIEPNFAPRVTGGLTRTVAAGVSDLTIAFNPGRTPTNVVSSLNLLTLSAAPAGISVTRIGNNGALDINLTAFQRGELRRAGPVTVRFTPRNAALFAPTAGSAAVANNTVTLAFPNIAPDALPVAFSTPGNQGVNGNLLIFDATPDPDSNDVTVTGLTQPALGSVAVNTDGTFIYTPPGAPPAVDTDVTFTFRVTDGEGASDDATATITLFGVAPPNVAPVAVDDVFAVTEDVVLTANVVTPTGAPADTDADAGPQPLSVTFTSAPQFGALTPDPAGTGGFTYAPNANATGDGANQDSFTYQLTDGVAVVDATVTLNFTPDNDAPTAPTLVATVNDEQGEVSFDLLQGAADVEGDTLTVSGVSVTITAPDLVSPTQSFSVDGATLTFDPIDLDALDANQAATLTFDYLISDGTDSIANQAVITVIGLPNGVGRIAGEYANTLRAAYNAHFQPSTVQNASCHNCHNVGRVQANIRTVADCNAGDLNAFGLALCLDRDPGEPPLVDLVRRLRAQEATFAPRLTAAPALTVSETAAQGESIGAPLSQVATPGLNVDGQPTTLQSFAFVSNEVLSGTDATGQFSVDANGQLRVAGTLEPGAYVLDIRPINDAGQRDNLGQRRSDLPGFFPRVQSLLRFITITVTGARPVAVNDSVNAAVGVATTVQVAANDVGARLESVAVASAPANGSVAAGDGLTLVYTSEPGFVGEDSFTYTLSNDAGASNAATVTVTVVPAGAPVARADVARTTRGAPVVVDVLANDEGEAGTVTIVDAPLNGVATVGADNRVTYTPADGFDGPDTFTYEASNAIGASRADVVVTVSLVDGDIFAEAVSDPALVSVARAMGDDCAALEAQGGLSPDAADLVGVCRGVGETAGAGGSIDAAIQAVRNEETLAASDATMAMGRATGATIGRRLGALRAGGQQGLDVSSFAFRMGEETLQASLLQAAALQAAPGLSGVMGPGWGGFLGGELVFGDADGEAGAQGFDLVGVSFSVGVDRQVADDLVLGVALSYARSDLEFSGGGGLDGETAEVSVYGFFDGFAVEGLSLSGFATYGFDEFDQSRRIAFNAGGAPIDRTALADYSGDHVNLGATLDYDLSAVATSSLQDAYGDAFVVSPLEFGVFATADYLYGRTDAYTESGAGGLNLAVEAQDFQSLQLAGGLRAGQSYAFSQGVLTPFGEVSLGAELLDDERTATSRFVAAGAGATPFVVTQEGADTVVADLTLGARFQTPEAILEVTYGSSLDTGRVSSNRLAFRARTSVVGGDSIELAVGGDIDGDGRLDSGVRIDYAITW